jgi:hypothetical protein
MIINTSRLVVVVVVGVVAAAAAAVFVVVAVAVERHDHWCYSLTLFRLKVVLLRA